MTRIRLLGLCTMVLVGFGLLGGLSGGGASAPVAMAAIDPAHVKLEPAPIRKEWILEGHPTTQAAEIARTADGTTRTYVWQTSAGRFNWFYDSDEVVTILDGEVFVTDGTHTEHRLGPGDVAFFPAGAATTWRVPDHLRKIAVLRHPLPGPIAGAVATLRALKRWLKPTTSAFAAD